MRRSSAGENRIVAHLLNNLSVNPLKPRVEAMAQDIVLEERRNLRRNALLARDTLDPALRHAWSIEIAERLYAYLPDQKAEWKMSSSIHCYISVRSEVETREFIERELRDGVRVIVPIVEQAGTSKVLAHTEIKGLTDLAKGHFGLDEPLERNVASLVSLDAVIVPLVAFDRRGTRLGYGMGFYDRFLHELPREVKRIGLAFSMQEVSFIPSLAHDEPLDAIVTERAIISIHE